MNIPCSLSHVQNEEWAEVAGGYLVSSRGRFARYGKLCNGWLSDNGYCLVEISRKKHRLHRVVFEAFRGSIPDGMVVDHLNCVKTDNRLENLEVVTQRENVDRAVAAGRYRGPGIKRSGWKHSTTEEREELKSLKRAGVSKAEIIRRSGRSKSFVESVLKDASREAVP